MEKKELKVALEVANKSAALNSNGVHEVGFLLALTPWCKKYIIHFFNFE